MVYTKDKEKNAGIDGGLMQRMQPGQPFINYIYVDLNHYIFLIINPSLAIG
ncbi:hypothetical protein HZA96_00850 [Candidatus Woesearchaeota archaeon]|nr:hypothetical protein [Candidatus Woesearchaeota archaeon]